MNRAASGPPGRRGVTILLTAALLGAIIPVVGLAIDASLLYAIKARLSAAADWPRWPGRVPCSGASVWGSRLTTRVPRPRFFSTRISPRVT